jgi:hypothetical protein
MNSTIERERDVNKTRVTIYSVICALGGLASIAIIGSMAYNSNKIQECFCNNITPGKNCELYLNRQCGSGATVIISNPEEFCSSISKASTIFMLFYCSLVVLGGAYFFFQNCSKIVANNWKESEERGGYTQIT